MGKLTKIEWCDSTVNPTGFQCCGCELWNKKTRDCYAGRFAERVGGKGAFDQPVQLKPGRMADAARWPDLRGTKRKGKPWLNGRPRVIFIGDMADTLQPDVPFDYLLHEVIGCVTNPDGRRHIWMWLTKQAKRLVQFSDYLKQIQVPWPENLWPGVTVTSSKTTWRIDELVKVPAQHRFISFEPAWGPVNFMPWTRRRNGEDGFEPTRDISMIIVGGQSGNNRKPFHTLWAADTIYECESSYLFCFVKQLGSSVIDDCFLGARIKKPLPLKLKHPKGGDWNEWPEGLRVRQFPEI